MAKSKVHEVTIRARFDAPLTAKAARYAVWNAIQGYELYGMGKPRPGERSDYIEAFDAGKITVRR